MASVPDRAHQHAEESAEEGASQPYGFADPLAARELAVVSRLYRRFFPAGGVILDLLSSCVCHLPPEAEYSRVVGVGMNIHELAENPFLDEWHVLDLNSDPTLPFTDGTFDGAAICVTVQHLTQPVAVLREVGRVLAVGAPLVITFSDHCFHGKAGGCWRAHDEGGHVNLVSGFLAEAGNWRKVSLCNPCLTLEGDPLYAVIACSRGPFQES